jgi:breast cancer 2 susceptibility protein
MVPSGPSREPARKRQRLSSPTYDEQIMELSQDDLKAFDEIEANFFRDPQSPSKGPGNCRETRSNATGNLTVQSAVNESEKENLRFKTPNPRYPKTVEMSSPSSSKLNTLSRDIGVPSIAGLPSFSSAKIAASDISGGCSITAFSTAALNLVGSEHLSEYPRSPSPENPPERDYSSWFESQSTLPTVGFQASGLHVSSPIEVPCGNIPIAGFMKASNKKWLAPSAAALAQAEERMKKIWQEEDPASVALSFVDQSNTTSTSVNQILSQPTSQNTLPFASVPDSPSPASFGRPALSCSPTLPPLISPSGAGRFRSVQPFKPPRMSPSEPTSFQSPRANSSGFTSSLLNPNRPTRGTSVSNGFHHPLACASVAKPSPFDDQNQTECSPGLPRAHAKPKFVTPFKSGMKPGEPGRQRLNDVRRMQTTTVTPSNDKGIARDFRSPRSATTPSKLQDRRKVFDLCG